jgi:phosphohistidine phosphatase
MELLVIRHAIAADRAEFAASGQDDAKRPLTAAGRRKMRKNARGLARIAPGIDLLVTSPLVRAVETAAIVADTFGTDGAVERRELEPDADPADLVTWLRRQRGRETVAVVGHEPHLSRLVEWLLTGRRKPFLDLKKGGACLLDLGEEPRAGAATLEWLLTPAELRRIAGK